MTDKQKSTLQILIVDDAGEVREGLRTALTMSSTIEIAGEAANGLEAIRQVEALHPDVVLMDLEMSHMDGYEATRQIKSRNPDCRIIALTVHDYDTARNKALEAGVDGFIVKGTSIQSLLQAILSRKE